MDEPSGTTVLHSVDAAFTVHVQFQNGTERFVDVIWIDYIGQWIRYETLSPGDSYDVYTYVSHPWVFLDGETGIRLDAVGRGKVFSPLMSDYQHELDTDGTVHLLPVQITVSVPVFTLRQRCLEIVCLLASDRDAFLHLNLPREIVVELQNTYDAPSQYRVLDSAQIEDEPEEADDEGFNGTGEEIASQDLTSTTQGSDTFELPSYQTTETEVFNESMIFEAVSSVIERLQLPISIGSESPPMTSSAPITSATTSATSTVGSSRSAPPRPLPRRKFNVDQTSTTEDEEFIPADADDEYDSFDDTVHRLHESR